MHAIHTLKNLGIATHLRYEDDGSLVRFVDVCDGDGIYWYFEWSSRYTSMDYYSTRNPRHLIDDSYPPYLSIPLIDNKPDPCKQINPLDIAVELAGKFFAQYRLTLAQTEKKRRHKKR